MEHNPNAKQIFLSTIGLVLSSWLICTQAVWAEIPAPTLGHRLNPVTPPIMAPDFELQDMDEKTHRLSNYRGQVVMLNFWATWCPPCRREMPSMEAVYQRLREQGLVVLAINEWESNDHVFAFMGQLSVFPSFPILFDQQGTVAEAFKVNGLPTTLVINTQGQIVYRAVGGRDFDDPEVVKLLQTVLSEQDSSAHNRPKN